MRSGAPLPLEGLLVVDFSQYLAAPAAALRLADLGARVIKVERPGLGDANRKLNVKEMFLDGSSYSFHAFNRNKESFAADLKSPADRELVKKLLARADVLIHNFRPGVMERLELGYEALKELNPGLVFAEVTGYGDRGPWREKPGQDLLVQARSGLVWLTGDAHQPPVPFGLSVVDMYASSHLVQGILAAVVRRERTGSGAHVAVSLFESAIDLQFEVLTTHLNDGGRPPRRSAVRNAHAYLGAPYGLYETADGYLALAMGSVPELGRLLDCPALEKYADPGEWFSRRDEIKRVLQEHLKGAGTAEWLRRLESGGYWAAPVLTWKELFETEAFQALDTVLEIERSTGSRYRTTRAPLRVDGRWLKSPVPSPEVGEHTARIARELEAGALAGWLHERGRAPGGAPGEAARSEAEAAAPDRAGGGAAWERPLEGIVVVDMSQFLSGPSAALRLADLGARVIKLERPGSGDICRRLYISDTDIDGDSTLFHAINRNKESVALDLKDPEQLSLALALLARADVVIENFRPGVAERLGVGYERVRALNPGVVYASITGYGPDGPWRDRPGQDLLVQSLSGLAWLSGDDGQGPVPMGLSLVDMLAGAHAVQGILACLARRARTGLGGRVEVSLLESALDIQFEVLTIFLNDGGQPPRRSAVRNAHAYVGAPYGIYPTADGHLALAMGSIELLAELLECPRLLEYADPGTWFARRDAIKALLEEHLKAKTTAEWLARLEPADFWCAEVLDWNALLEHEAFRALELVQEVERGEGAAMRTTRCPIRIDGRLFTSRRGAPAVGRHTAEVLEWLRAGSEPGAKAR